MKRFYLDRQAEETNAANNGRSNGKVLEGVLLPSGRVVIEWGPPHGSLSIFNSIDEFQEIHISRHPSKSELVWLD